MKTRIEPIDFFYVEPHHREIDKRLANWGRSQYSRMGGGVSPMFRSVKPSQQWDAIETTIPVNQHDAMLIAKGIASLPTPHALSMQWCYVRKTSPKKGCELLRTNMSGLAQFIKDARTMLVNRRV